MAEFHAPYRLVQGKFGQWIIVNARDPGLAWSGSCWVEHEGGIPTGGRQVSNFATEQDARIVAQEAFGC
jgi:hypothetical protein